MNHFTLDSRSILNECVNAVQADKVFILCDQHTMVHCLHRLQPPTSYKTIIISAGEGAKNLITARTIWSELAEQGATRKSLLISLGGGTVTDIGGFVASTYQRGISFIHIPTTLLAMVDASIGGKTGINLGELKNYIGVFNHPHATITDPGYLATLPDAEITNGCAEIIKHGALAGGQLWDMALAEFPAKTSAESWLQIIEANAAYKAGITGEDFRENAIRARLNFGHTAGHALEALYLAGGVELPHGQAVAAGMWIETLAASALGLTSANFPEHLQWSIRKHFKPVTYSPEKIGDLMGYCIKDKKYSGEGIACSLVKEPGQPLEVVQVPAGVMNKAFSDYLNETGQTV